MQRRTNKPSTVTETPINVGRASGPSGEVVTMSNQAWKTATTSRLPRPRCNRQAKIHEVTQMLAANPRNPMSGTAR